MHKKNFFPLLFLFGCSIGLDWEQYKNTLEGKIIARYTIATGSIIDMCYSPERDLLVAIDDYNGRILIFSGDLSLQKTIPTVKAYVTCTYSSSHGRFYIGGDDATNGVIDSIDIPSSTIQAHLSIPIPDSITRLVSFSQVLYFLGTYIANGTYIGKTTSTIFPLDSNYGTNGTTLIDSTGNLLYFPNFFLGIDSLGAAVAILNSSSAGGDITRIIRVLPGGDLGGNFTINGLTGGFYLNKEEGDDFWIVVNFLAENKISIRRYSPNFALQEDFAYSPPFPAEGIDILRNPLVEDYEKYIVGVSNELLFLPSMYTILTESKGAPIKKMVWKKEGKAVYLLTKPDISRFEILLLE